MTTPLRSTFVLACGLAAACSSNNNNGTGADASGGADSHGAVDGTIAIDAALPADASADAPNLDDGIFAIPLLTPTGDDQGAFYSPALTASGKTFLLDLDTGSTVTGIAGTACTSCTGMSPLYTPGAGATNTTKTDSAQYADGSRWSGTIYSDTVGLGHGTPDVTLAFVNISSQSHFFSGNEYQGILGLGPDALLDPGTTAYPDQVFAGGIAKTMAFELCPTDGTMWLGGYDTTHATAAPQFTPILTSGVNSGFYEVNMTGISFGSASLGVTSATLGNPIVDTGTTLFYIPSSAETSLIAKINADAGYKALFPGQTLTDPTNSNSPTAGCVNAAAGTTPAMIDAMMPALSETFAGVGGGSPITISAPPLGSYFYDAGGGQFCLGVYGGGDQGDATMGDMFMRGFVTIIDLTNKQVGFVPTTHCTAPAANVARGPLREHGRGPHHAHRSAP